MADTASRFDALVTPHLATLHRVAYRFTRNSPDAHDLVQESCVAACENLAELEKADRPDRWLLRVMQNRFFNLAKRRRRSPLIHFDEAPTALESASADAGPEDLLQQRDAERHLQWAFLKLEPDQRTLLALRAEGYGLEEIATITGVDKKVLRARLHRARTSLARHLEHPPIAWPRSAS